jgi:hypothetical protein
MLAALSLGCGSGGLDPAGDDVSGFRPNPAVFLMAENAFAHAGMEIRFRIDDTSPIPVAALPTGTGSWTWADLEQLLLNTDDPSQDIHAAYLHVIVVPDDRSRGRNLPV